MIYTLVRPFGDPAMNKLALWVGEMMTAAEATATKLGRSAEAIVAQAALETSWGRVAIGHNLFGIKADTAWRGPTLVRRTAEQRPDGSVYFIDAPFRDYASYADSIADHFTFLTKNTRYRDAGVFTADSDRAYFEALQRAGYATDVQYADKLMEMVASVKIFTARLESSQTAPGLPASSPRLLMMGMTGGDVETAQKALRAAGFYAGPTDGDFGQMTRAAVEACQRARHLSIDGAIGAQTRASLGI